MARLAGSAERWCILSRLTVEQLKNMLAADLREVGGIRHEVSYSTFNDAGSEFDKLIYAIIRNASVSGFSNGETDQLLALLRPTVALKSVINGAIAVLDQLLTADAVHSGPPTDADADADRQMARLAQAVGDNNTLRIIAMAQRPDLTGEQRMIEALRLDKRFEGKSSSQWADLLKVTPAAVRGYETWKALRSRDQTRD